MQYQQHISHAGILFSEKQSKPACKLGIKTPNEHNPFNSGSSPATKSYWNGMLLEKIWLSCVLESSKLITVWGNYLHFK